jgi:hypothetical protein
MRITWKNHPHDSTKNSTTEHVSRELAAVAVGYGQAVYAPYKNYVDRLNDESKFRATAPPVVEWNVLDAEGPASIVRVIKREGSNLIYFDAPPRDAPKAIVVKFNELAHVAKHVRAANAADRARVVAEQEQEQLRELNGRY